MESRAASANVQAFVSVFFGRLKTRDSGTAALRVRHRRLYPVLGASQNPAAYAYKLPRTLPAEPWRGVVDLGNLATDTTLVAIGQSRHMGGGLLVPFDVPTEEYDRHKKEEEHD